MAIFIQLDSSKLERIKMKFKIFAGLRVESEHERAPWKEHSLCATETKVPILFYTQV